MIEELRPGLWTWTAPHPKWTPDQGGPEGWDEEVRSYAVDADDSLLLFDPLITAADVAPLAAGRPVVVLLTVRWHRRSTEELVRELGAAVHAHAESVPELEFPAHPFALGDELPGGVRAFPGAYSDEASLWIEHHSALVTGDAFLDGPTGFRLQPDSWLLGGQTPEGRRAHLAPLLELPVELLLPTHGDPVVADARDTLHRALAPPS